MRLIEKLFCPQTATTTTEAQQKSVSRVVRGGKRRWGWKVLGGLLSILAMPSMAISAQCDLKEVAKLPVKMHGARGLRPVVATKINGIDANLIFDTGGALDVLFQAAILRLKLRPEAPPPGFQMRSFGQPVQTQIATADHMTFGGIDLAPAGFVVTDDFVGDGIDGFLGQAAVAAFDVEFDLADGVIRLFAPVGCENANLAYWADPQHVSIVNLEPFSEAVRPFGEVKVNGILLRALFDSGMPDTDLTSDAARRAGVFPGGRGVSEAGTASGLGAGELKNWQGPFSSLVVGNEAIPDLTLNFTAKPNASADLIIGADYFVTHRIMISKSQGKLYSTPIGAGGLAAQPKHLLARNSLCRIGLPNTWRGSCSRVAHRRAPMS